MYRYWGAIPNLAITQAEEYYSKSVIVPDLIASLEDIINNPYNYFEAAKTVKMKDDWAQDLITNKASKLLSEMNAFIADRENALT